MLSTGITSEFLKHALRLQEFTQLQNDRTQVFKTVTKSLYDSAQRTEGSEEICHEALPKLIIKNFSDEQVWQQLELKNTPVTVKFSKCVNGLHCEENAFDVTLSNNQNHHFSSNAREADQSSEESSDYAFDGSDSDEDDDDDNDKDKKLIPITEFHGPKISKVLKNYNSASVIDDKFFKVSQLEEFLRYEDLKEEREQHDGDMDESDVDLFADIPSDDEGIADESSKENVQSGKSVKDVMYKDFFDPPEAGETADDNFDIDSEAKENAMEDRKHNSGADNMKNPMKVSQNKEASKKLRLLDDSDDDNSLRKSSEFEKQSSKTAFEKQQEKERKKIKELEASLLRQKPWQLTGEVAADRRPPDSLLRQQVEFDSNLKQDFVATDEITERVENIIKMAISNKAWCDVEVKENPIEDIFKYKPVVPLDEGKSKKSLAEVYEDEYLKRYEKEGKKEDARHVEIKKMMDSVVSTLSTLFSHTPRPPVPEIKVISNMPAITVEEVAPVGVSNATLLAPEEIKPKLGLPIGKSERTETDKKRERRKKKKLQKIRMLENEEREKKRASVSKKEANKFSKQQAMKKIRQQKNVTIVHEKKGKRGM